MSTVNDENIKELNEEHDTCRCHYDEFQLNQNYHECLFHFRFRDVLLRRILNSMEKNGLDKQRLNYLNFAQSLYVFYVVSLRTLPKCRFSDHKNNAAQNNKELRRWPKPFDEHTKAK